MIISGCYHAMAGEDSESPSDESTRFTYYQHVEQMIKDAKSQGKEANLKELFEGGFTFTSWDGECYKFNAISKVTRSFKAEARIERYAFAEESFGIPPVLPKIEGNISFSVNIYKASSLVGGTLGASDFSFSCDNQYLTQKEGRDVLLCELLKLNSGAWILIRYAKDISRYAKDISRYACYFMQNEEEI